MKTLTLLFIMTLSWPTFAHAQTWDELDQKVSEHYEKGDYKTAIDYAEKAKNQAEKEFSKEHKNYATSLAWLPFLRLEQKVTEYYQKGDYKTAIDYAEKELALAEKEFGKEHPNYATSLNNLAFLNHTMGNYAKAEPLYIEALNIKKKVLGPDHPDYATPLNNLAALYVEMGNYAQAEPLLTEALNITKKTLGTAHPDYAGSLNNLAFLYSSIGNYAKAEPLFIEALNIRKKALGPDDSDYAASLTSLAELYCSMGSYAQAEPLLTEALNIRKKVLGTDHPDYASSLNGLAVLYESMGNNAKAEPLLTKALNIRKKALGTDHPTYANSLNDLALLYYTMGNNAKAEPLLTEALNIRKKVLGMDHPEYANSLNSLAVLYESMGNYTKAEPLLTEALNIRKKALGPDHPDYATSLNSLAVLYESMGNYDKAEPLFIEAMNIYKKALGPDHPDYATSLNNLASLYDSMGNYDKAASLFIEAMSIYKKAVGTDHPDYANSLNNLAFLYDSMGNYAKAEPLYIEALNIWKKAVGTDHPDYATSLNNLALLYDRMGNEAKAEPLYIEANDNLNNQINQNFAFLSEKEKEQFLEHNIKRYFKIYNSYFLTRKAQNPSITTVSYNNELAHKGMLLQSNMALRQAVYAGQDSVLIGAYEQFITLHKMLTQLYAKPIAERGMNTDSLETVANTLEKELMSKGQDLPGVEDLTGLSKIKWTDVRQALKADEAAIEFISFQYYDKRWTDYDKRWTDSTYYCALVLRQDSKQPDMIYLCEERQLQALLSTPRATDDAGYISQLYRHQPAGKNSLYQLIWQPINSQLSGIKTIHLAPSGLLHKVAFSAIPISDNKCLADKYNLHIVSSTRILAKSAKFKSELSPTSNFKQVLYGGIIYDDGTLPEDKRGYTWSYLPGTLSEVTGIEKLAKAKGIASALYTGNSATEESFKHLADSGKSPDVIHIATHGFFFPEVAPAKKVAANNLTVGSGIKLVSGSGSAFGGRSFNVSGNPLLRSGILLAGAGRGWNNEPELSGGEDGVLTANEVSNINLSHTQLVALSACETGLGDVKGSEGVFGLQRAFKMAGVRYLIMSLWQVPDSQTSELMNLFYTNWFSGQTIKAAFSAAQQTMREKYDPFYWAAFVLIE